MKLRFSTGALPESVTSKIDAQEATDAQEVCGRPENVALIVENTDGSAMGYAVFGRDKGDMVAIYYARSFVAGIGPVVMKQLFGASKVLGVPLRVHANTIRELHVKARLFGADVADVGHDADGILQGVFS